MDMKLTVNLLGIMGSVKSMHRVVQEFSMHNYIHHLLVHTDFGC